MKTMVGVDAAGGYKPVVNLVARMNFDNQNLVFMHASDDSLTCPEGSNANEEVKRHYAVSIRKMGVAALQEAQEFASSLGLDAQTKIAYGNPATKLNSEAVEAKCDLVAVCACHYGKWLSGGLGSVSRAMALYGQTSVLISKGDQAPHQPFRAVYATDHSAYAERALDKFLKMKCKGIREVHVVSAYEIDDHEAEAYRINIPMLGGDVDRYMENVIRSCNDECCDKLSAAGYATSSTVAKGDAIDVIRQLIGEKQADLLIVGAQGAGCFEDLLLGSVALHQAVAELYPVLIVRP